MSNKAEATYYAGGVEPHRAYLVMEVEDWVFNKPAPEFEKAIDDEVTAIAAELKDHYMQLFIKGRNPNV
jgi:hypothetical protein